MFQVFAATAFGGGRILLRTLRRPGEAEQRGSARGVGAAVVRPDLPPEEEPREPLGPALQDALRVGLGPPPPEAAESQKPGGPGAAVPCELAGLLSPRGNRWKKIGVKYTCFSCCSSDIERCVQFSVVCPLTG